MNWIAVCLGGALGSGLRYGAALALESQNKHVIWNIPVKTLVVNLLGGILLGFLSAYFSKSESTPVQLFLMVGFCGGFTTYSTFNHETLLLLQKGQWAPATLYIGLTLVLTLMGGALGAALGLKFVA